MGNRIPQHPVTEEALKWAKRLARDEGRTVLSPHHVLFGYYCVAKSGTPIRDVDIIPEEIEVLVPEFAKNFEKLRHTPAPAMSYMLDDTLRDAIAKAYQQDTTLPPSLVLTAIFERSHDKLVEKLRNKLAGTSVLRPKNPFWSFLLEVRSKTETLVRHLQDRVLGQDAAVRMLAEAYRNAILAPPEKGPRGIFTFLGPPGVGKTLLAETFAAALQQVEGSSYVFTRFDMSTFAGHQNFEGLFGASSFYSHSRRGLLTDFVAKNPRSVILFDEIEKAHINTITALLSILDRGEVKDLYEGEPVDFSQSWIIFTTNLGREFFGSPNSSGILENQEMMVAAALDILRQAQKFGSDEDVQGPALPPEFVSRLAKGGVVAFRPIGGSELVNLAQRYVQAPKFGASSKKAKGIYVHLEDKAAILWILSLLPNLDARRVGAKAQPWLTELFFKALEDLEKPLLASHPGDQHVFLRCDQPSSAFLDKLIAQRPLHALLVDEDSYLEKPMASIASRFSGQVFRVDDPEKVADTALRHQVNIAFVDLTIGQKPDSARVEKALRALQELRVNLPEVPVWLYSENPEQRENLQVVVGRIVSSGGARGFVPCHYDRKKGVILDNFLAHVENAFRARAYDLLLAELQRTYQTARFDLGFRLENEGLVIELSNARLVRVLSFEAATSGIQFSGIPQDRFDDLVGLSRAKARLQQVVAWLKNPNALRRFGVDPPRGFLLAGPPGTGKTMLARATAGEARLPFLALSAGELLSKWTGESEERVRELFDRAHTYAPAIVFIDEIDAIGVTREAMGAGGGGLRTLLNQLLASLDGVRRSQRPILVLAATNYPDLLDPALVRPGRFDEVVPVDLPDAAARRAFFEKRLQAMGLLPTEKELQNLVSLTFGCSPATLDRITREAVYAAAANGRDQVTMSDVFEAARFVIFGAVKQGEVLAEAEKRRVAYHEAGHTVLHLLLTPDKPLHYITIVPHETGALGFVAGAPRDDEHVSTKKDLERELAKILGGRAAEHLAFGAEEVSTGASSDLEHATRLAFLAAGSYGFDTGCGLVSVKAMPEPIQTAAAAQLHEQAKQWLDRAFQQALKTLEQHRGFLDAVAQLLLEREALDGETLKAELKTRGFDVAGA